MKTVFKITDECISCGSCAEGCPVDAISEGDKLKADMDAGVIYNLTTGDEYKADPFPPFIQEIISTGGLIESIKAGKIK